VDGFNIGRFLLPPRGKVYGLLIEAELDPKVLLEISSGITLGLILLVWVARFVPLGGVK